MAENLFLTRSELADLSGFRLPEKAIPVDVRRTLTEAQIRERLTIPPLSTEQIRVGERNGIFDPYAFHQRQADTGLEIVFSTLKRRQGEATTYPIHDVLTARMQAWLLRDGVPYSTVREALRGEPMVRALLQFGVEHVPDGTLILSDWPVTCACVATPEMVQHWLAEAPSAPPKLYPLEWLGWRRDVLPRVQKMREKHPTVKRWNQDVSLSQVARENAARRERHFNLLRGGGTRPAREPRAAREHRL